MAGEMMVHGDWKYQETQALHSWKSLISTLFLSPNKVIPSQPETKMTESEQPKLFLWFKSKKTHLLVHYELTFFSNVKIILWLILHCIIY